MSRVWGVIDSFHEIDHVGYFPSPGCEPSLVSRYFLRSPDIPLYLYPNCVKMSKALKSFMHVEILVMNVDYYGLVRKDALNGQKEDTTSRIKAELHPRKKVKKEVELWVENAERINVEIQNLESEVEAGSFLSCGFLGKNVRKKIEEVEELLEKGRFSDGLVVDDPSWTGQVFPTPSLVGETIKLKKDEILGYLMNNEVVKIGVHGMPGVGKTSVMKLVNNELLNDADNFNIVVWVTVSGERSVVVLQNKIARAMGAVISEDEDETIRAGILSEILGQKGRYVLILDDVREHFSLEEVGIPEPSASNGSKLVLTTRSLDVCRRMDCQEIKWKHFLKQMRGDCSWKKLVQI
ncbi:PREDICTED: disease resistance protein RFL1-like [Theobroma cacao]|uniref:Disease resistance protein RFL1-like n=1 Tax=Theobroma cacao TaxID=3641 RepID=A0AB32WP53_THECC|nr:PREDICTED: disease resistance protein RFL1-like [Theobroma cacao]